MRAPTGTLLRGCVLILVGAGLLAGCSENEQPGTLPEKSPKPSTTSASPTPSTPEAEVEAAVRAYYAELTRAAQTQDTSQFKSLMSKSCPCFNVAKAIDEGRRDGKTTPDANWSVRKVDVHDLKAQTAGVEVRYVVDPYRVLNSKGKVLDRYPRQTGHVDLTLLNNDEAWIVANLFDLES